MNLTMGLNYGRSSSGSATPDQGGISSVTINSDGWSADVLITGYAGSGGLVTYDFGTPELNSGKFALLVTSEGYSSSGVLGTVQRVVYGTKVIRLPYPNESTLDEVDSGADLLVRIALSDYVYTDDKDGGAGTSGVNPTVTTVAGWATNGVPVIATTNWNCINSSIEVYPSVIGQWDFATTKAWQRQEADFEMAFRARNGLGIAAVKLTAAGAISAHSNTSIETAITLQGPEQNGLYHEAYSTTIPIAGYTQGEKIELRAIAYPIVGDESSMLDTDDYITSDEMIRGRTSISVQCDKDGGLKNYAVVSTTGNDGTGVASTTLSTAEANPFLTVGNAISSGASIVYCRTGEHKILGVNPAISSLDYAIEVRPHPSDSGMSLLRDNTAITYNTKFLAYFDFTINGNYWVDGNNGDRQVMFVGCDMTASSANTVGLFYRSKGCWFIGCTNLGGENYKPFSTSRSYNFTGCTFTKTTSNSVVYQAMVACNFTSNVEHALFDNNIFDDNINKMLEHNEIMNCITSGLSVVNMNGINGVSIIGNIIETSAASTVQPNLRIGGDGDMEDLYNVIIASNTIVGNRCNLFYNDSGSVANVRKNTWCFNNAFQSYNMKSDTFSPQDGGRIGNWAQLYGVGYSNNIYDGTVAPTFTNEYDGLSVQFYTDKNNVYGEIEFVDDASVDGTGLGNGDYTPDVGSVLRGHSLIRKCSTYDSSGNLIDGNIGALQ